MEKSWGKSGRSNNRDCTREDSHNNQDNPYARYKQAWLTPPRRHEAEQLRPFSSKPVPILPQPCRLCEKSFPTRELWQAHVDQEHGGLQRYRNAFLSLASVVPYVVRGQEWRLAMSSYTEFLTRAAKDWENFTESMLAAMASAEGLPHGQRWEHRHRAACVFCARLFWSEDLVKVHLAGDDCFMRNPGAVAKMLAYESARETPLNNCKGLKTVIIAISRIINIKIHAKRFYTL